MAEKKPSKDPLNPNWLKWIIIGIIVYAGYMHLTGKTDGKSLTQHRSIEHNTAANTLSKSEKLPDLLDRSITVTGEIPGSGDEAQCGQIASVRVEGKMPDGSPVKSVPGTVQEIPVGYYRLENSWVAGLTGMRPGGIREIQVPANRFADAEGAKDLANKDVASFKLFLDGLKPVTAKGEINFHVVDLQASAGRMTYCGDEVSLALTLYGPDGTALYQSTDKEPLRITIGGSEVAYGIDRALLGMREDASRLIIIPPAYNVAAKESTQAAILKKIPEGKMMVAEVTLLAIKKPATEE